MKRLGTVRVCGVPWTVNEGTSADLDALGSAYGICDPGKQALWLHEGLPLNKARDTLTHEVLHAILGASGAFDATAAILGVDRDDPRMARWEESIVRVLTPHVLGAFGAPELTRK